MAVVSHRYESCITTLGLQDESPYTVPTGTPQWLESHSDITACEIKASSVDTGAVIQTVTVPYDGTLPSPEPSVTGLECGTEYNLQVTSTVSCVVMHCTALCCAVLCCAVLCRHWTVLHLIG